MSFFDVADPKDGLPIVFIPGMRANRKMWVPHLEALADTYRVIAVDLPGYAAFANIPFSTVVRKFFSDTQGEITLGHLAEFRHREIVHKLEAFGQLKLVLRFNWLIA